MKAVFQTICVLLSLSTHALCDSIWVKRCWKTTSVMSVVLAAFLGLCLYLMVRMLNLASPSLPPSIFSKTRNSPFIQAILASCPILREPYVPPLLWGKSGHIQTVVYAKIGRMRDPLPSGQRHTKTMPDGSTLTFDLYQPVVRHFTNGDFCMLVCPGFGSSSESKYIRALVNYAQNSGYRVAVLNHLGSLFSQRLTAPRIFSYGGWEEFHTMRQEVQSLFPQCMLIAVGLSMGANIVLKYLGERPSHQRGICCAISVCQGYNINHAKRLLKQWQNLRRAYLYTMTANQRRLIRHHGDALFSPDVRRKYGLDLKKIFAATTLEDLDLHFTCKLEGVEDLVAYYDQASCSNYLSHIKIPLVLLNSEDDPIIPLPLLKYARDVIENHEEAALITTKHGGHLGYFENGFFRPEGTSWIDRFVCQLADGVIGFSLQRDSRPRPNGYFMPSLAQTNKMGAQSQRALEPRCAEVTEDKVISEGHKDKVKSRSSLSPCNDLQESPDVLTEPSLLPNGLQKPSLRPDDLEESTSLLPNDLQKLLPLQHDLLNPCTWDNGLESFEDDLQRDHHDLQETSSSQDDILDSSSLQNDLTESFGSDLQEHLDDRQESPEHLDDLQDTPKHLDDLQDHLDKLQETPEKLNNLQEMSLHPVELLKTALGQDDLLRSSLHNADLTT